MSKDIKIKNGLTIRLKGEADKSLSNAPRSRTFAIRPSDFHLFTPKLVKKEGEKILAGETLFYGKQNQVITFSSPVSGTLTKIERGPKRVITNITIEADQKDTFLDYGVKNPESLSSQEIKNHILASGCWPFVKQRPYDVIANPDTAPKAIFISGLATGALDANLDFVLQGKQKEVQTAITALSKLTDGAIHLTVAKDSVSMLSKMKHVVIHKTNVLHPAGNVGTQINKIDPVNKGETVWTIAAQDLVIIGELFLTGKYNAERIVALVGSCVKAPKYYKTRIGSEVATMVYDSGLNHENVRVISGGVLSGDTISPKQHLGFYHNAVTVIPQGDDYEFFGWNKPVFNKISPSRALTFSWMQPNKEFELNTNTNGEHRAFVVTGNYEEVFPLDIYPLQILKACLVKDLDAMEALGMYEVAPEDFALTEFVCVSKQPHQQIIREGLDLMYKEIG